MSDGIGGDRESEFEKLGHEQKYEDRSIVVGRVYRTVSQPKEFCQAIVAAPGLLIFEVEPGRGYTRRTARGKEEITELLGDVVDFSKIGQLDMARTYRQRASWIENRTNNGHQLP